MAPQNDHPPLPWLRPTDTFPAPEKAWGVNAPAPGLLAAGADLSPERLITAYSQGIFPWFSADDPFLWWSPDPRAVLSPHNFRCHRSLRQTIRKMCHSGHWAIKVDIAFTDLIHACAHTPRGQGHTGTWIQPSMIEAYTHLHQRGLAHSVEVWQEAQLVGGLYCVALGRAVFGESMFSRASNASKVALAALVAVCRAFQVSLIDCQQNTTHLALMGSHLIPRSQFTAHLQTAVRQPPIQWQWDDSLWAQLEVNPTSRPPS